MQAVPSFGVLVVAAAGLMGSVQAAGQPSPASDNDPLRMESKEAPSAHGLDRSDLESWVDGFMATTLARSRVAGATVAVVGNGEVLLQKAYGYADFEAGKPVEAEVTLFRLGSLTKLFTATAVMQLVEEGRLDLDRDVNAYLDFELEPTYEEPVTLRHLLTHTSGFEEQVKNFWVAEPQSLQPLGVWLGSHMPARIHPPGQTPVYSNFGIALAGYIVERVSGLPYADYVERRLLEPLQMTRSSPRQPLPAGLRVHMSEGYGSATDDPKPFELLNPSPAGSLSATGADMARFMIGHLQEGIYDGTRFLQPETARLMQRYRADAPTPLEGMALGFRPSNRNGRAIIGHGGDTHLFHSELRLFIDEGIGVFIAVNSSGRDDAGNAMVRGFVRQFADRHFPGSPPSPPGRTSTADAHSEVMAGRYQSSRRIDSNFLSVLDRGEFVIESGPDGTIVTPGLRTPLRRPMSWQETAPFVWLDTQGQYRLVAEIEDGRVVRIRTDNPSQAYEPVPWWRSAVWNEPALLAARIILVLTLIVWPIGALIRRHYGIALDLRQRERSARWLAGAAAVCALAVTVGWSFMIARGMADSTRFNSEADPWLIALQLTGLLSLPGAAVAVWNAWCTWQNPRRGWLPRVGSVLLTAACIQIAWTTLAFNLVNFSLGY